MVPLFASRRLLNRRRCRHDVLAWYSASAFQSPMRSELRKMRYRHHRRSPGDFVPILRYHWQCHRHDHLLRPAAGNAGAATKKTTNTSRSLGKFCRHRHHHYCFYTTTTAKKIAPPMILYPGLQHIFKNVL